MSTSSATDRTYAEAVKPLALVFLLALTLYAWFDCTRTPDHRMKAAPKPLWLVAIALVPVLGPVTWLAAGRIEPPTRGRTRGPDDDPAFLRRLDDEQWRRRQQRRRDEPEPPVG